MVGILMVLIYAACAVVNNLSGDHTSAAIYNVAIAVALVLQRLEIMDKRQQYD